MRGGAAHPFSVDPRLGAVPAAHKLGKSADQRVEGSADLLTFAAAEEAISRNGERTYQPAGQFNIRRLGERSGPGPERRHRNG
jgi:hypothetical protein